MTPQQFTQKWQGSTLNERKNYQAHFADCCCNDYGCRRRGAAYGWMDYTAGMSDEEILRRLLVLNLARAGQ